MMQQQKKRILLTGGSGFIGSNAVRYFLNSNEYVVGNIDKLTYAGNPQSLADVEADKNYHFFKNDICDKDAVQKILAKFKPDYILHLAAESHVDRSIDGPAQFIHTNIVGTSVILESALHYWSSLTGQSKDEFRLLHVSTDEVFGSLNASGLFSESTAYDPRSPYSASKASSDHLVRAWNHTYGLPILITNCSNNYGPFQFPEKLIPVVTLNALHSRPIPVYGNGENIRDWLYVEDHVRALEMVITRGKIGETYLIGGHNEIKNIDLVTQICETLDALRPLAEGTYKSQITFVKDRPGHDKRYAIDASKIARELDWKPSVSYKTGLKKTIVWYLANSDWIESCGKDRASERLGLSRTTENRV